MTVTGQGYQVHTFLAYAEYITFNIMELSVLILVAVAPSYTAHVCLMYVSFIGGADLIARIPSRLAR